MDRAPLFCPRCPPGGTRPRLDVALRCARCGHQWPALAGGTDYIPVIVPDVSAARRMVGLCQQLINDPGELARWAESADALEAALAGGLLTYAQAHYGAYAEPALPSAHFGWLPAAMPASLPDGPVAFVGAGPGGEVWALRHHKLIADRERWVVDANLAALAWGQMLFENGAVVAPWRSAATRIDYRTVTLPEPAPLVRWVCADALFPPWQAESLALVVSVGLVDSVAEPFALIQQIEASLAPNGVWLMASPWNWQSRITPPGQQLERHVRGDIDDGMAALFSGGAVAGIADQLVCDWRADDIPWRLPVHPRYAAEYRMQALRLRKRG